MILSPGSTSVIKHVFIQDSSVTTGAGKTGLAYGDITAYYVRAGGALTALTLETISTLGTWASSGDNYLGFKLLNDTNAPGVYELHLPNNILAAGANQVTIQLRATGAAPCNIEIQLANVPAQVKAQDNIDFGALQKASLNAATPEVTLADDAITAAKYDESTAFPLKSADTGASQVARVGADSDTLETLSDQLDAVKAKTDNLPSGLAKNVALADFEFLMIDSADHITPKTGLTVAGTISKDGGAFAALDGSVTEISGGVYKVSLTQTEMNADIITLIFTAAGADQRTITFVTS